ncbi:M15 family metallopeptidase [Ferrimonas aestuarii]|uniref:D-alanyl-D-alanine carboxypeptidase family protein n=1 Tax=Ferrimonas aestuarii TaxID=2569539 RepID=A0A4U1BWK3_9GAMM|nr:M15 family metallopeptidase [Ferrimonas aestuarii]TKB57569.1 D-alanyl-D-alanine carboxypeptidase family protein [Ferrimonas aestuarii]
MLTQLQLLGQNGDHLVAIDHCQLESRCALALRQLQDAAALAGFNLQVASGWRSFERQLLIFNRKARGERPLLDSQGKQLSADRLNDQQKLEAILQWSALPGMSRHHWGTDLDIYDANAISSESLKLEPWEYDKAGPNGPLSQWLSTHMHTFGFYRPYQQQLGGVQPEPWHLSFAPVSAPALQAFEVDALATLLEHTDIELKSAILDDLEMIASRYLHKISPVPENLSHAL